MSEQEFNSSYLKAIERLLKDYKDDGDIKGSGTIESLIFGSGGLGDSPDNTFQKLANAGRLAITGDSGYSQGREDKRLVIGQDFKKAVEAIDLKGALSNQEGALLKSIAGTPVTEDTADEVLAGKLRALQVVAGLKVYRERKGIKISGNGKETVNGQEVFSYMDSSGKYVTRGLPEGSKKPVILYADVDASSTMDSLIAELPAGETYILNGEPKVKE